MHSPQPAAVIPLSPRPLYPSAPGPLSHKGRGGDAVWAVAIFQRIPPEWRNCFQAIRCEFAHDCSGGQALQLLILAGLGCPSVGSWFSETSVVELV